MALPMPDSCRASEFDTDAPELDRRTLWRIGVIGLLVGRLFQTGTWLQEALWPGRVGGSSSSRGRGRCLPRHGARVCQECFCRMPPATAPAWGIDCPRQLLPCGHWESPTGQCRQPGLRGDCAPPGPHFSCLPRCLCPLSDGRQTCPQSTLRCPVATVQLSHPGCRQGGTGSGKGRWGPRNSAAWGWAPGSWVAPTQKVETRKAAAPEGWCSPASRGLFCLPAFPPFAAALKDALRMQQGMRPVAQI